MDNPEKPKIKVTDRRHFTPKGERRESSPPQEENGREEGQPRAAASRPAPTGAAAQPSIEFETLVLSLTRQALMLMGEEPDPQGGAAEPQLEATQSIIDMLMALRDKTRGNLTPDEESLVGRVIYELQMKFAQKTEP